MRSSRQLVTVCAAAAAMSLIGSSTALADNVNMGIVGINSNALHLDRDASAQISVALQEITNGDTVEGCNAGTGAGEAVSVVLSVVDNNDVLQSWASLNDSPSTLTLTFTDCVTPQIVAVKVSSDAPYNKDVKIDSATTGGRVVMKKGLPTEETGKFNEDSVGLHTPDDVDGDGIKDSDDLCDSEVPVVDENLDGCEDDVTGGGGGGDVNAAPTVTFDDPIATSADEGDTTAFPFTITDEDSTDFSFVAGSPSCGTEGALVADSANIAAKAGTFQCSFSDGVTPAKVSTVSVAVSDGTDPSTAETTEVTVNNLAPVVAVPTATQTTACAVSIEATFTDAGLRDTHTATINWGDGTLPSEGTVIPRVDATDTTPAALAKVTGTHTYSTAYSEAGYLPTVTVTDKDGGDDAGTATAKLSALNTPSGILQPINAAGGTRSSFKLGSTIPVKITVKGCDGESAANLQPAVHLQKNDNVADVAVNEAAIVEAPTNGKAMRWSDTQYVYNLSTKLSQFTAAPLTSGTYQVSVTDASFYKPSTATMKALFDVKK